MPLNTETITKIQAGIPKLGPFETREEALRGIETELYPFISYYTWPPEQKGDGKWWVKYLLMSTTTVTLLEPLEQE